MTLKIKFTDKNAMPIFFINHGDKIVVKDKDGREQIKQVFWDGPNCIKVDGQSWNITDYARHLEDIGASCRPKKPLRLPYEAYCVLPSSGELVRVVRREAYYTRREQSSADVQKNKEIAANMNRKLDVTPQLAAAMLGGVMSGWDSPAAKPEAYDYYGNPIDTTPSKEVEAERCLDLTLRIRGKGFDVVIFDNATGSEETIACEDLGSCRIQDIKDCHIDILREIQFWVDSIREEACGGEEE